MPRRTKTARQLSKIKRERQYEAVNRMAKKVLYIWSKERLKEVKDESNSRVD